MDEFKALIAASVMYIVQHSGNVYVYIKDATGKTRCYTIVGDVKVTRGRIEVVSRIDTTEWDVHFPGDE